MGDITLREVLKISDREFLQRERLQQMCMEYQRKIFRLQNKVNGLQKMLEESQKRNRELEKQINMLHESSSIKINKRGIEEVSEEVGSSIPKKPKVFNDILRLTKDEIFERFKKEFKVKPRARSRPQLVKELEGLILERLISEKQTAEEKQTTEEKQLPVAELKLTLHKSSNVIINI